MIKWVEKGERYTWEAMTSSLIFLHFLHSPLHFFIHFLSFSSSAFHSPSLISFPSVLSFFYVSKNFFQSPCTSLFIFSLFHIIPVTFISLILLFLYMLPITFSNLLLNLSFYLQSCSHPSVNSLQSLSTLIISSVFFHLPSVTFSILLFTFGLFPILPITLFISFDTLH